MVKAKLLHQADGFFARYNSVFLHVCEIAHQVAQDALARMVLNLLLPGADGHESLPFRNVEHKHDGLTALVEDSSDGAEGLLTSGVPNVELNLAVVGEEGHGVDLDSEGGDVLLFELTSQVALDESGLASAAVADEHQFEFGDLLLLVNPKQNGRKSLFIKHA